MNGSTRNPDTFRVTRTSKRHLGFGEGSLAVWAQSAGPLEARIALEEALPVLGTMGPGRHAGFLPQQIPSAYVWDNTQHARQFSLWSPKRWWLSTPAGQLACRGRQHRPPR